MELATLLILVAFVSFLCGFYAGVRVLMPKWEEAIKTSKWIHRVCCEESEA